LRENQNSRAFLLQFCQELVQQYHLASILDEMRPRYVWWSGFSSGKEIWMVRALPELHDNIFEVSHVTLQNLLVIVALHLGEACVEISLFLWGEAFLDLGFEASEDKWTDGSLERFNAVWYVLFIRDIEFLIA